MEYDGPRHDRIRKKLHKIAKTHGVRLWFRPSLGFSGEYHVGCDLIIVQLDNPAVRVISTFFHELGHHTDFHNKIFRDFYDNNAPLKRMRPTALKAERHADATGEKLCKKYFPKIKYEQSYRTAEDLYYLRAYYADGRSKVIK